MDNLSGSETVLARVILPRSAQYIVIWIIDVRLVIDVFLLTAIPEKVEGAIALHVFVRDVSCADIHAPVLASASFYVDSSSLSSEGFHLELNVGIIQVPATIEGWLDVDSDGRVSEGDFITMQSYPIPNDDPAKIRVTLQSVGS
jgi:hypothetical protein